MNDNNKPICITFAGPIGSGKTPIAYYLSWNLGLPMFSNDIVRLELIANNGVLDKQRYSQIKEQRVKKLIASHKSFIYDASVDRHWGGDKSMYEQAGYEHYLISLDFSLEKIKQVYTNKGQHDFKHLEITYQDHQDFLVKHSDAVNLSLTDADFDNRFDKCLVSVKNWLKEREQR